MHAYIHAYLCGLFSLVHKPLPLPLLKSTPACPSQAPPNPHCHTPFRQLPEIQQVRPALFIGTHHAAVQKPLLSALGITHIVSMIGSEPAWPRDFEYHTVYTMDNDQCKLLEALPGVVGFIREAMDGGGAVLIHCRRGVNRSGAMLIAYLMREERLSYVKVSETC